MYHAAIIDQAGRTMEDFYQLLSALGPEPIDGQLMHAVGATAQGLRHIEVWESAEHGQRFGRDRLAPAFAAVYKTDAIIADVSFLDVAYYSDRQHVVRW